MLKLQQHLFLLLVGTTFSSADDDSDSIGSESMGSGISDESSGTSDESSSVASAYSSIESSSGGNNRRGYRRGYRDAQRYGPPDYRQIPPRGRRRW